MISCEDNILVMHKIEDSSLDFIYSDILYGTGRDFREYTDIKAEINTVSEFYRPRFEEMHRVLKDTGSIVLQMDKRINHWIRILLDEIFGYNNFRNEITWCYSGGGVSKKKYSCKSDVLIWYSKSSSYYFCPQFIPYTGKQKAHPYSKNREEKVLGENIWKIGGMILIVLEDQPITQKEGNGDIQHKNQKL